MSKSQQIVISIYFVTPVYIWYMLYIQIFQNIQYLLDKDVSKK